MPSISGLILNYNGGRFIEGCLSSVFSQNIPLDEVVVVDNGSTDGSPSIVKEKFPRARLIEAGKNLGFSGGMNLGIKETGGDLLLLLNPDVVLENTFVSALVDAVSQERVGSATGKVYRFAESGQPVRIIDTTGHMIFKNRLFTDRGEDQPDQGQYDQSGEVFGPCAGIGLYKRAMLEDVKIDDEYFDESFFLFLEDTDLNWRAQLRGWKSLYVPEAVARHHRGGVAVRRTKLVELHNYKNRYMMLIKNDSPWSWLRNFHHFAITDTFKTGALLLRCPPALLGWFDVWRNLPALLRKRRIIQRNRLVSQAQFERWLTPFSYRAWIKKHIRG